MYVFEICAEGIFVTFPWWLENVKSRSKITLVSNERHLETWYPKTRTITFFWSKLSKPHKKDLILHVATTFSLKLGETRTSHGPIPRPLRGHNCVHFAHRLKCTVTWNSNFLRSLKLFSVRVNELFEPTVFRKKATSFCSFLKVFSWETKWSLSNARWFYAKNAKLEREICV